MNKDSSTMIQHTLLFYIQAELLDNKLERKQRKGAT